MYDEGIVGEPLAEEGLKAGQQVHDVEPAVNVDEDETQIKTSDVAHTLKKLLDVLG